MVALGLSQLPDVPGLEDTFTSDSSGSGIDMLTTTHVIAKDGSINFRRLEVDGCSPFSKLGLIVLRVWVYKYVRCVETSTTSNCL